MSVATIHRERIRAARLAWLRRIVQCALPLSIFFLAHASAQPTPAPRPEDRPATVPQSAMVYLYNGPESPEDHRYDYHWQVLRAALERTVPQYGPYRMESAENMSEERQIQEIQNPNSKLTVLIRGDTLDYASALEAVWIPIDKGLLGYRVFLIRREDQAQFTTATTLDELRHYTIGQGSGWKDIEILRANGLKVMPGGAYAGLFTMLANGRFDLFSRGVEEVWDEYAQRTQRLPTLAIEQHLLLYYPIARYFWFARTNEGQRLVQRVRDGMRAMIDDGTLDRMFTTAHQKLFDQLHLESRKLFVLSNPLAAPQVPLGDARLWYRPMVKTTPAPN